MCNISLAWDIVQSSFLASDYSIKMYMLGQRIDIYVSLILICQRCCSARVMVWRHNITDSRKNHIAARAPAWQRGLVRVPVLSLTAMVRKIMLNVRCGVETYKKKLKNPTAKRTLLKWYFFKQKYLS